MRLFCLFAFGLVACGTAAASPAPKGLVPATASKRNGPGPQRHQRMHAFGADLRTRARAT
jgi:hypothetical protein